LKKIVATVDVSSLSRRDTIVSMALIGMLFLFLILSAAMRGAGTPEEESENKSEHTFMPTEQPGDATGYEKLGAFIKLQLTGME
jgi:hypothetical protein